MRTSFALLLVPILALGAVAQQTMGPDVTVSSLTDVGAYGQALGQTAFAVGTVACNVGNSPVLWISSNNQHPVIAQNMYRYLNGQFQQVGMSWLKHAFASTNSPGCGSCVQPPMGGSQLGVGCTDAYGSGLNGSQGLLGPRSEVNAATGAYVIPHGLPVGDPTLAGRIQVPNADITAGGTWFVDAHYITADDAFAHNGNNNASWQQIAQPAIGQNGNVSLMGSVHAQQPGIYAWQTLDAGVTYDLVDVQNDGRFIIGKKITALGGGNFHYEFAIMNLNSDRSGRGFTVAFPAGTTITNGGFRSVPYHSGEPYANTPWSINVNTNTISWVTQLYINNPNANALRWSTTYNFWCDATAAAETTKSIELFKPESPCALSFTSPNGPGSVKMDNTTCPAGVGMMYLVAVSLQAGNYPNGWLFGVDISIPDLGWELAAGAPFTGLFDANGASSFGPISGVPPGLTIYAVTLHAVPGMGVVNFHRPSVSYVVP